MVTFASSTTRIEKHRAADARIIPDVNSVLGLLGTDYFELGTFAFGASAVAAGFFSHFIAAIAHRLSAAETCASLDPTGSVIRSALRFQPSMCL